MNTVRIAGRHPLDLPSSTTVRPHHRPDPSRACSSEPRPRSPTCSTREEVAVPGCRTSAVRGVEAREIEEERVVAEARERLHAVRLDDLTVRRGPSRCRHSANDVDLVVLLTAFDARELRPDRGVGLGVTVLSIGTRTRIRVKGRTADHAGGWVHSHREDRLPEVLRRSWVEHVDVLDVMRPVLLDGRRIEVIRAEPRNRPPHRERRSRDGRATAPARTRSRTPLCMPFSFPRRWRSA